MPIKATPPVVVGIALVVAGAGVAGAFVLASGYGWHTTFGFPSLCPPIGTVQVPEACEVVSLSWPTPYPCTGPASSYVVSGVSFTLQPYVNCGGVVGRGINVNVTEASDLHYAFPLDNGAPPAIWLNWTSPDGRVAVDWAATTPNVTLVVTASIFTVSFEETGLPVGTNWSVTLASALGYSISNSILFTVGNGSYGFHVGAASGYTAIPSSGIATVAGADVIERVTFA
jgi:hypothetical protein